MVLNVSVMLNFGQCSNSPSSWLIHAKSETSLKSTGQLAKTDRIDAAVLAHFAEVIRPPTTSLCPTSLAWNFRALDRS